MSPIELSWTAKNDVFWIYWQKEHTLSIGYGIWLQNKNTWLSRSRRWMSLNFSFHRYLFFIRVGLICRKQRRFCNCLHVFSKMFLHQVCWKHHHNFLWIPFSIFSLFCLFLAFFIGRQYCASQFQGDDPEILSKTKFCFWFGEHQLMWSNCWRTIFDSITHYCHRKADSNTTPNGAVCRKNHYE